MIRPPSRPRREALPERDKEQTTAPINIPQQTDRGLLRAFTALRQRNYRLFWFGQMISLTGTWMQTVGQAWLVLELTHSAWQLGVVGALQFLPVLLFSLFGGVFADRLPKRSVLLATQTAAMIQADLLFVLLATHTIQLWHIYVLAMLLGLTNSLDQPARSAFVAELVGRDDLPNAVALNSSLVNLARIVGPGIAGIVITLVGVTPLFLLNALSFLAVIAGLALITRHDLHAQARQRPNAPAQQSTWQSLREGVNYVGQTPPVLLLILVVGLVLLFGANFDVFLPLFATNVLRVGASGFGFLSAANGIGALLSGLWLAWSNQRPTIRRVLIGAMIFGVLEAIFAASRIYPLSLALIAGIGVAETIFGAMAITTVQTIAPDRLRGRVTSVYVLSFTGSIPPGYLLSGWLSSLYGASIALLICAILCLLTAVIGWQYRKPAEEGMAASIRT
jgi:MFS family permease